MIFPGHALSDGGLHETRQRRQHVHGRVNLPVVQLAVDVDLPLGNVAGQIGDGMGDVVVGHGQDRDLGDRSVPALDASRPLVDGGQVGVHVTRETTAAGHLLTGGRHLAQRLGVRGHVGEDDQHVLLALVREELGGGQGQAGRDDPLDGGVVGQVQEQAHVLHGAVLLEVLLEEARRLHVDAHGGEHNGEVVLVVVQHRLAGDLDQPGLPADLRGDLVVGETGGGEYRNLLSPGDGVHHVDGADARLDHFLRVDARPRVDRLALDVQVIFRQDRGTYTHIVFGFTTRFWFKTSKFDQISNGY